VGMTRACRKLVLCHRPDKCDWLRLFAEVETIAAAASPGEYDLPGLGTSLIVRSLSADMAADHRLAAPEEQTWLAPAHVVPSQATAELFHNPSRQARALSREEVRIEELLGPHPFPAVKTEHYEALGNAVHAYLAALPSLTAASDTRKAEIALNCLKACEAEGLITPQALVAAGARLEVWVRQKGGISLLTEVPVTAPRSAGGQWLGTIDLLVEVDNNRVLLVDHKSRPIPAGMAASACLEFSGQLAAYREILEKDGISVASSWIHFPLAGVMVQIE
jgi:ATP-dependent helicase/nuclease subunit A